MTDIDRLNKSYRGYLEAFDDDVEVPVRVGDLRELLESAAAQVAPLRRLHDQMFGGGAR